MNSVQIQVLSLTILNGLSLYTYQTNKIKHIQYVGCTITLSIQCIISDDSKKSQAEVAMEDNYIFKLNLIFDNTYLHKKLLF